MGVKRLIKEVLIKIIPTKKDRIIFMSYNGRYTDSPKCISEKIHELNENVELVWLVNRKYMNLLPEYVKCVEYGTLKALYYYASGHVIIDNVLGNKESYLHKSGKLPCFKYNILKYFKRKRNQYVYTTWHGTPIKKIGSDELGNKVYDFDCPNTTMIVDNEYICEIMERIYFGKIDLKLLGAPRNDIFHIKDEEYINQVKRKLGIEPDKKVILFAPTFRRDVGTIESNIQRSGINQIESIDFNSLFEILNKKFGGEWVFVCRFHYHVDKLVEWEKLNKEYGNKIINGNKNEDIAEYLLCTDVLISDISSCMYDFSETSKPIFSFFPDYDYYENEERGLYVSMKDMPFGYAKTFDELVEKIETFDENKYNKEIKRLREKMRYIEVDNATENVTRYILEERALL